MALYLVLIFTISKQFNELEMCCRRKIGRLEIESNISRDLKIKTYLIKKSYPEFYAML